MVLVNDTQAYSSCRLQGYDSNGKTNNNEDQNLLDLLKSYFAQPFFHKRPSYLLAGVSRLGKKTVTHLNSQEFYK